VMDTFKNHLHLPVTKIDDSQRMLARLKVCSTPPPSSLRLSATLKPGIYAVRGGSRV
jgi:hypothetical protein